MLGRVQFGALHREVLVGARKCSFIAIPLSRLSRRRSRHALVGEHTISRNVVLELLENRRIEECRVLLSPLDWPERILSVIDGMLNHYFHAATVNYASNVESALVQPERALNSWVGRAIRILDPIRILLYESLKN